MIAPLGHRDVLLGEVPAHWEVSRFGRAMQVNTGQVDPRLKPWSDMTLVAPNHIESGTGRIVGRETAHEQGADSGKYFARQGQILYSKIRPTLNKVALATEDCLCSADMYAMSSRHAEDDTRYLAYYMLSAPFHRFTVLVSMRVKMPKVNREELAGAPWVRPPALEQRRIADYLDVGTAQIDGLIAKQAQLIDMLRQRRVEAIASATLRGVDPLHIPTESPVQFAPLGYGFFVTLGKMLDGARPEREGDRLMPYVRAANVQDDGLNFDDVNSMPYTPAEARELDLCEGDVLVVEGGAVGTSVVLSESMPGWSFQKTINRLRVRRDWDPRFVSYVLRTYREIGVIDVICNKSTIPHLTAEKLRALRIPAPPADEQRQIADALDVETARIDALIAKANQLIALARERRAALITAAVTGQIDVTKARKTA